MAKNFSEVNSLIEKRYEWIDGVKMMSPSPGYRHQSLTGALYLIFGNRFKNSTCTPLFAPLDVKFPESENGKNTVQPDLMVICDKSKIQRTHIEGAPSLIVEIVSHSNQANINRDVQMKFSLYEKNGVQEYWIVHTDSIAVYTLVEGKYQLHGEFEVYDEDDDDKEDTHILTSVLFPELKVDVNELFKN